MRLKLFVLIILSGPFSVVFGQLINPVVDADFPDPTVVRFGEVYYAYATQGRSNIQVRSSTDLQHWKILPDALPQKPVWANIHFWAPHVLYDRELRKYVMFYSGESVDDSMGKCLGVAYADKPEGPFVDKGSPLICGAGFINIDPMAFIDPKTGKKLLYWGSDSRPIKVQEMTADWSNFKSGSKPKDIVSAGTESKYTNLIEGAWLDFNNGKYYLYYSGDNCCGPKASYAVMVSRSVSAFGPFIPFARYAANKRSVILEKDSNWLAPGHNSVFNDAKGNKWIAYHAIRIDKTNPQKISSKREMLIKRLVYQKGWPVVLDKE